MEMEKKKSKTLTCFQGYFFSSMLLGWQ